MKGDLESITDDIVKKIKTVYKNKNVSHTLNKVMNEIFVMENDIIQKEYTDLIKYIEKGLDIFSIEKKNNC
jgi:hypothetical protein